MKRIISKIAAGAAAEAGAEATRRGLEKLESSEERERREAALDGLEWLDPTVVPIYPVNGQK